MPTRKPRTKPTHVLRLYDGFDNLWIDVAKGSEEKMKKLWNERTSNGTQKTSYGDIDYYRVFPVDTKMVYS